MIQPGLCGAEITSETHYLAARRVNTILGNIDNEVRQLIDEIGVKTGLSMIVNTILDANHQIVGVVAGEPIAAPPRGGADRREGL